MKPHPLVWLGFLLVMASGCGPAGMAERRHALMDDWLALEAGLHARREAAATLLDRLEGRADVPVAAVGAVRAALLAREPIVPGAEHPVRSAAALERLQTAEGAVRGALLALGRAIDGVPSLVGDAGVLASRARLTAVGRRVAAAWRRYGAAVDHYNRGMARLDGWLWSVLVFFDGAQRPRPTDNG